MSAPLLKYCGNQTLEDYQLTRSSKASYIGIVFYKKSKRYVSPEDAASWVRQAGKAETQQLVGVFVNPSIEELTQVLDSVALDIIQLHGSESPDFVKKVREEFHRKVWKAIHHDEDAISKMQSYQGLVDGYVIDCKVKDAWGGTGQSFDWAAVPDYKAEAGFQGVPYFIAGGVSPLTINQLLPYQPMGIDLASGIEEEGKKSLRLVRELERKVVGFS